MSEPVEFAYLEVPPRIADLEFRVAVPRDWNPVELPVEDVDFSVASNFFPMLVVAAPWAAVVLTVVARPGFEDGTLQDWSLFLLDSQGIRPTSFGPAAIGNLRGLVGVGRQEQDGTWLEVRFGFFEDGGRLVHLGLLAPEAISAPLEVVWKTALESFELARPQGQDVELGPRPEMQETELGFYAKAEDASRLDPENAVNARLRDQEVGFAPKVLAVDLAKKSAKVGVSAIHAVIGVALGWHVIDDGRRTMVLDPDGKIQISLNLIDTEDRSIDAILDEIQAEAEQSYEAPEFLRLEDNGIWGLAIRNIVVNGEAVEQLHMLTARLRARVTADPQSMRFAANYAELILKSAEYGN